MEEKDYFVQIYIEALRHTLGTLNFHSKQEGKRTDIFAVGGQAGIDKAVEIAEMVAIRAMKPIENYGKKK